MNFLRKLFKRIRDVFAPSYISQAAFVYTHHPDTDEIQVVDVTYGVIGRIKRSEFLKEFREGRGYEYIDKWMHDNMRAALTDAEYATMVVHLRNYGHLYQAVN